MPVSAQECAASAVMEAEPVIRAATVFAPATTALAKKAMITVSTVSPSVSPPQLPVPFPASPTVPKIRDAGEGTPRINSCK